MDWVIVGQVSLLNVVWHPTEVVLSWEGEVLHKVLPVARLGRTLNLIVSKESVIAV